MHNHAQTAAVRIPRQPGHLSTAPATRADLARAVVKELNVGFPCLWQSCRRDEAVHIANDTVYGLAAYVQSTNIDHARAIAKRMRAGSVYINYPAWDTFAPFGGYKQSGNGREYADWAIHDFLEIKGVVGWE